VLPYYPITLKGIGNGFDGGAVNYTGAVNYVGIIHASKNNVQSVIWQIL